MCVFQQAEISQQAIAISFLKLKMGLLELEEMLVSLAGTAALPISATLSLQLLMELADVSLFRLMVIFKRVMSVPKLELEEQGAGAISQSLA